MVEGLLQRIRDPARIEIFLDLVVGGRSRFLLDRRARRRIEARLVGPTRTLLASAVVALPIAVAVAVAVAAPRAALVAARAGAGLGARVVALALALRIGQATDRLHVGFVEIDPDAALEAERQHHGAVADADQPAHSETDRLEQLSHLAIAAFGDDDPVPGVQALAAAVDDRLEGGALALDLDPFEQLRPLSVAEGSHHPDRVLALDAEARMHELVGQAARVGEQEQAFGVDVEPADRLPLALVQARQAPEHGRPMLGIVVGDDLASRLVVREDPCRRRDDAHPHRLAVDLDPVPEGNALTGMRWLAVDRDPALDDQVFHVAARADAGLRQHLVQLGRIGFGGEHPLAGGFLGFDRGLDLGVEITRE